MLGPLHLIRQHRSFCNWAALFSATIGVLVSAFTTQAKDGDANATGKIKKVDNGLMEIIVSGNTDKGALWLGCTFYPGTEKETDLASARTSKGLSKLIHINGSFTDKFHVPSDLFKWAIDTSRGQSEAEYVVALWRYRVGKVECRNGQNRGPCKYCLKNEYHLEDPVDVFPGSWSFESKGTTRQQSEELQRDRVAAEQQARLADRSAKAREQAEQQAKLEEKRKREREDAQLQAKLEVQRQTAREDAESTTRIEGQRKREREETRRLARLEEQKRAQEDQRRQQEDALRQARAEAQRAQAREEAQRQARLEDLRRTEAANQQKTQQQSDARRDARTSVGAEVRTITPQEMKRKGFNEVFSRAEIISVSAGSPAARAGLKPGMVVIAVNDKMVLGATEFPSTGKRGDTFRISVVGQGEKLVQIMDSDF